MKINEILVESTQLDEAGLIKTAAKGVGKAVGGIAKGIGAVAGGIAGIPGAVKKGFQAGKAAVQGDNEPSTDQTQANLAATGNPVGAPSGKQQPAAQTTTTPKSQQTKPTSTQAKPAAAQPAGSKPVASKSAAPAPQQKTASTSAYSQIKANVDKLDKKGKQRILQAIEKELGPELAKTKPEADVVQPTNKPGALGSLVQQQLATAKTKTATGGTVTNPKPGVTVHKANPNNPNLANA